jgi:hypothetical protein
MPANAADGVVPPADRAPALALAPTLLAPDEVGIGRLIPDFQLRRPDDSVHRLSAQLGHNGAVIVVRDADCPVSRRYGPRIAALAAHYAAEGFGFVVIYPKVSVDAALRARDDGRLRVPGALPSAKAVSPWPRRSASTARGTPS